jgi:membrane-bound lytic murein transglycosylase D
MRGVATSEPFPCAFGRHGYDTVKYPKARLRRSMHDNNNNPIRSRAALRSIGMLVLAAALAACQSFGTRPDETAAAPAVEAVALSEPLEPIVVPHFSLRDEIVEEHDLLTRLRGRFSWAEITDPAVAREVKWYSGHPQYMERVFQRADLYLFHIVTELERRGMPAELALLPIVESAFDPFAYSHGRAAGLWQIIPGTGKRLGLAQNWWFDGRRDVLESTRAALDYLAQMHEQFGGDWLLAVAGYNSGEGNVARALRRAAADGKPQDFWGIKSYLPAETRTYVPRLLAVRDLVADPLKYGIALPELANEAQFAIVETGSQIDMALAAELAGIDTDRLYALNAGVNRWATDPDGPHRLLVPAAQAKTFATALTELGERERVQWTRHRVKQGETIGQIADKFRTTAAVLREVNSLRGNTIKAGDYLMIPTATAALERYTQSAEARAERQQSVQRTGDRQEHVVLAGESLWSISRSYGVDVRNLASWNSMAPGDVLSVGRNLVVWTRQPSAVAKGSSASALPAAGGGAAPIAATVSAARSATAGFVAPAGPGGDRLIRQVTYTVRRGDSLSSIARRFRVTVANLVEWNDVSAGKYLQPGQRLKMFVNVVEQSG